jgi:diphthamide synthase subunit DPH2
MDDVEFDVEGTVDWAMQQRLTLVALQIPDALLCKSGWLARRLTAVAISKGHQESIKFVVLADTNVSLWEPDVVAAQHINADGLVLYGSVSLGQIDGMKCRHVFGNAPLNIELLVSAVKTSALLDSDRDQPVIIIPALSYAHCIPGIQEAAQRNSLAAFIAHPAKVRPAPSPQDSSAGPCTATACSSRSCCGEGGGCSSFSSCADVGADISGTQHCPPSAAVSDAVTSTAKDAAAGNNEEAEDAIVAPSIRLGHYTVPLPAGAAAPPSPAVYVGPDGPELTRLVLESAGRRFLRFDPAAGALTADLPDAARALRRRYYAVMRCRDAERVGVVVATAALAGRAREAAARARRVVAAAGKRCHVFFVGRPSPAKLANFQEVGGGF